ncbi:chemotaxis protein [Acinetobacter sp. 194]|uniref:chemotaxis protein n=1 Tax=Acinetobacter shaoyimingii TaxID=2715164 RepID=UPI00140BA84E|nr:chemotaxis protein [Acinetobacter shaoyimingii]NHB57823.1 chemotaxis protein [Acinetobacter shaoyimingii]
MSYQTSIHFDPTSLLIIKKEIDNSIQLVESAVNSLIEDHSLPFGIDDALIQLQQCAKVLILIDMPHLAKLAEYASELMNNIMQKPDDVNMQEVVALSEGTTMLKRYIEFSCLREVNATQFLLDTINILEVALGKPLTQEGADLVSGLEHAQPNVEPVTALSTEKSVYAHKLYKICLDKLLSHSETELDLEALKAVAHYLAQLSVNTPSQQYWHLVNTALKQIQSITLSDSRLRTLIGIETNLAEFITHPETFEVSTLDLANVLSICIGQEDELAIQLREQFKVSITVLSDTQLQVLSRHLYGPDLETIHVVSNLVTEQMAEIRNEIEYNYQSMSEEKTNELKTKLLDLANVFKLLNLNEAYLSLKAQVEQLNQSNMTTNNQFAQELMDSILAAMNSIGILERNYTSSRLQMRVNNLQISLDRLDEAYEVLLTETKALVDLSSQTLVQYIKEPDTTDLEAIPSILKEISGAMLFLSVKDGHAALLNCHHFLEVELQKEKPFSNQQIERILDVLASVDMLIDNIQNKQPILQEMFQIALKSSQNLKAIA